MRLPLNVVQSDARTLESQRECGPCTACCVLPRIPIGEDESFPTGKRGYTPCQHLCHGEAERADELIPGCMIYDKRPGLCRDYKCLWRAGIMKGGGPYPMQDERMRPDKLGLMLTLDVEDDEPLVDMWELWEGAASELPGRDAVRSVALQSRVHIRFYGVPASIQYHNSDSLALGRRLSKWAREDPKELAKWLEKRMDCGHLTVMHLESVMLDLEPLRRGEPVTRNYARPGG